MTKFYRPPQGKYNEDNLRMAKSLDITHFLEPCLCGLVRRRSAHQRRSFRQTAPPASTPGAIVLLHSTSKTNAEILDELLTKWEEMGYTFGSLKQLIS